MRALFHWNCDAWTSPVCERDQFVQHRIAVVLLTFFLFDGFPGLFPKPILIELFSPRTDKGARHDDGKVVLSPLRER